MEPERTDSVTWSVRPLKDRPARTVAIYAVGLAAGAIGIFLFRNVLLSALGIAMILGSTAEYWLGTSYKLDSHHAQAKVGFSVSAMEWREVKRVTETGSALKLSPLAAATAADVFRGVLLKTNPANRSSVADFVRSHCPAGAIFETSEGLPPV